MIMIKFLPPIVLAGLAAASAQAAPAKPIPPDSIYGVWGRVGYEDQLEFYDCQGKLCAKGYPPPADGSEPPFILRNAAKTGPNQWKGDLFNPENGKTYGGKITLESPSQMTLTGCLVAFLCQSETWTRVPKAPEQKVPDQKASDQKPAGQKPPGQKTPAPAPPAADQ